MPKQIQLIVNVDVKLLLYPVRVKTKLSVNFKTFDVLFLQTSHNLDEQ